MSEGGGLGPREIGRPRQKRPVEIGHPRRELFVDVGRLPVGFGAHAPLDREKVVKRFSSCTSCTRPIGTSASWARHVTQRQGSVSWGKVASVHEKVYANG